MENKLQIEENKSEKKSGKNIKLIGLVILGLLLIGFLSKSMGISNETSNTSFVVFFWIIFWIGCYFLPSIIGRKKKNATSILVLNLFLGWTILGWIVALIWATTKD